MTNEVIKAECNRSPRSLLILHLRGAAAVAAPALGRGGGAEERPRLRKTVQKKKHPKFDNYVFRN